MIQEATITALKNMSAEESAAQGQRILVMRRWPRGLSWKDIHLWLPSAGPSEELLAAWNAQLLSWQDFAAQYRREQQQQIAYLVKSRGEGCTQSVIAKGRSIDYLHAVAQQKMVTVSCWERCLHCHRFLLVQLVGELAAQDLVVDQEGVSPCR